MSTWSIRLCSSSRQKVLARLTAEQERLTQEIREHKTAWAQRNFVVQNKRQTISSAELTAFREYHTALSAALAEVNRKIGEVNRELRANKATKQSRWSQPVAAERLNGGTPKKECPLKQHREYPTHFLLAARDELEAGIYAQVERSAKALLQHALDTGVEE